MWVQLGSLGGSKEPLFLPGEQAGPQSEMGRLGRDWTCINLDQKDCFQSSLKKKKKHANFPLLFSVRSLFCHLHYKLSSKPKLDKSE